MGKMKKILLAVFLIIVLATLFFYVARFLQAVVETKNDSNLEQFDKSVQADVGSISRYIEVDDAKTVAEDNLNLSFEFSGKIEKIFLSEGSDVKVGEVIAKLDTTDIELEKKALQNSLEKAEADLDKVLSGATLESVQIYKGKVNDYNASTKQLKKNLVDVIKSAYINGEDAVRGKTNSMFSSPNSSDPQLLFSVEDADLESDIESRRENLENTLSDWENKVHKLDYSDDLVRATQKAQDNLEKIQKYLGQLAEGVNQLTSSGSGLSQDTIDDWNLAISTVRANVDTAKIAIGESQANLTISQGNLDSARDSLNFINASARKEDVKVAQSALNSISVQLDILDNKIEKASLKVPKDGTIMKVLFKESENVLGMQTVVIFSTYEKKIQADISEEDIISIKIGNIAKINLKALPNEKITGTVYSIYPQPIIKNGDVFYRVDINIDGFIPSIREGMTADAKIETGEREQILRIPKDYVIKSGVKNFVNISKNGKKEEVEVEIGDEDEKFVEINKGINERDIVLAPKY